MPRFSTLRFSKDIEVRAGLASRHAAASPARHYLRADFRADTNADAHFAMRRVRRSSRMSHFYR